MASRGYAQIFTSIWSDDDFRTLSLAAQRHYFLLLSQPDINYAGVLPLTERRWARCCDETSQIDIEATVAELDERRYVVVDVDTEELLVRSFVRNDGLWKQPKMLAIAVREALATASAGLRQALAEEFGRVRELLPPTEPADGRVIMVEDAIKRLLEGPAPSPPEALGRPSAGPRQGFRAPARATPAPSTHHLAPTPRGGAAENASPDRARDDEPQPPSIAAPSAGPAVTGPTAADAYRLVDAAIGREHPHTIRTALAIEVGALLGDGTDSELIFAALRLWLGKPHLGPRSLPNLVSEAIRMRNRPAIGSRPSTTDQRVADIQALKGRFVDTPPSLRAITGGA